MVPFTHYRVTVRFTEPVLGAVPKDPHVFETYITKKDAEGKPVQPQSDEEVETVPIIDPNERPGYTGFMTDDEGIFVYNYTWLGFMRERGNTLKEIFGVKALRSKLEQTVFVLPRRIRPSQPVGDTLERPLRAMTAQGPRVTLAKSDTLPAGTIMTFRLRVLPHKEITEAMLRTIFEMGETWGFGQWRNGGWGTFEVIEFDKA